MFGDALCIYLVLTFNFMTIRRMIRMRITNTLHEYTRVRTANPLNPQQALGFVESTRSNYESSNNITTVHMSSSIGE